MNDELKKDMTEVDVVKIPKSSSEAFRNMRNKIQERMKEKGITYEDVLESIEKGKLPEKTARDFLKEVKEMRSGIRPKKDWRKSMAEIRNEVKEASKRVDKRYDKALKRLSEN